ncbi:MAG: NAD(+)/NADH kinase [Nanoarchaeota archaeon]|nr:NAD(+)/NADH kinase [Nanoarchaeota archaeon]
MSRVMLVYKRSSFDLYKDSDDELIRNFIWSNHPEAKRKRESHEHQEKTLETVVHELQRQGISFDQIYRADLDKPDGYDYVITVGGDGTLLEVAHFILDIPLLGVNSDPNGSLGFYSSSNRFNFGEILADIDSYKTTQLHRFGIKIDGKSVREPALNDVLFAHSNPAANTYYVLTADKVLDPVGRGSGVLMCTPSGSTAFLYQENGIMTPLDFDKIQYRHRAVRGNKSQFASEINIESTTRPARIYIDGDHLTYPVTLGQTLNITQGPQITIIGELEERRKKMDPDYNHCGHCRDNSVNPHQTPDI